MSYMRNAILGLVLILTGLAPSGASLARVKPPEPAPDLATQFADSLTALPAGALPVTGTVYVPAYSSVLLSQGRMRADFAVTLSIHNVSATQPLVLKRIGYFNTAGALVQDYLDKPVAVKPFATVQVFIATTDLRGGTGANFLVEWLGDAGMVEPAIEALMLGSIGNASYSFVSHGRTVPSAK